MYHSSGKDMLIAQSSEEKVYSPLLRDQGLQHHDIRSRQLLFCCAYSAHVQDKKLSITENYYFQLLVDSASRVSNYNVQAQGQLFYQ